MIEVSVYCITYNHRKYITRSLDSMLEQETEFDYEIIVHDDFSDDGTTEILRDYERRYPDKIIVIYESENQYSQGKDFSKKMFERIRGKYIAFCEGDDFWIDRTKLQRQWEALESHPECDMCACWGAVLDEDGKKEISQIRPRIGDGVLDTAEVIKGGGQYMASASLFYRLKMYDKIMEFEKVLILDYVMQIKGSLRGGIYYIDRKMAAYRQCSNGSWTMRVLRNEDELKKHWEKEKNMLKKLDEETDGIYHNVIIERLKSYTTFIEQLEINKTAIIKLMSSLNGKCVLWGMGRRGLDFEKFCKKEGIQLFGVCDATNSDIGKARDSGAVILRTDEVFANADVILASNENIYRALEEKKKNVIIINLQTYMPYG